MRRVLTRRLLIASVVAAGAAAATAGCSGDPILPDRPEITIAAKPPPPISGGTLQVTSDGLAVAADSDRDLVWLVDLETSAIRKVALDEGDEPGRVAIDAAGRAHIALRGAGALATVDVASGKVLSRTDVCGAPRGVAYDAAVDRIHVACAGGELVTLSPGGAITRKLVLDRDLRDVVVQGDRLLVTRFRAAQVIVLDAAGKVLNRQAPPSMGPNQGFTTRFTPTVAWRAVPLSGGGAAVVHQRSADSTVVISQPDGYGGGGDPCGDGAIVNSTVSTVDINGNLDHVGMPSPSVLGVTLPVDLATDGAGSFAIASAGSDAIFFVTDGELSNGGFGCEMGTSTADPGGQPIAVASWKGKWIAQTRQPAGLAIIDLDDPTPSRIELPGVSVEDSGHSLFHHAASQTTHLACASCHPEGTHDGHVWQFDTIGARRTQTVAGGVLDTAPLHWDGDLGDLSAIMHEVFESRMGGTPQGPRHIAVFADWIQTIPAPVASPRADAAQIARGEELYFDAQVGCATCHSGRHTTNNKSIDVGTTIGDGQARAFQVPTLSGIAQSGPYMHDGCAATLHDRFDPQQAACNGGDAHGKTSHLSASEIDDLVAYLETL